MSAEDQAAEWALENVRKEDDRDAYMVKRGIAYLAWLAGYEAAQENKYTEIVDRG